MSVALRLTEAVRAAVPAVTGVSIGTHGVSASVAVVPASQQAAAQATIDAFDWSSPAQVAWENQKSRTEAEGEVTAVTNRGKVLRALAAVLVDEINILRGWLVSFKAEVAAATNLADLKTRVAGLPNTPDRTLAQAKTAVANKISSGNAD